MATYLALAITTISLAIASIVAVRFKIPPLIVFLFMGMVIGSYGFLQRNDIVSFLGDLGSILLLFAIGTEFSIHKLFSSGFAKEMLIAVIEISFTFLVLFFLFSIWLKLYVALLLALAFTITSTGIALRLLHELNLNKKFDIPLVVKISVIEDLLSVFVFTIISTFSLASGQSVNQVLISLGVSVMLFIIAYAAFSYISNRMLSRFNIKDEDLLMLALGILLLMVSISADLGLSTSFGAYISGSIVSSWKDKRKDLDKDMKNFSYLFICFFFLTVGLSVDVSDLDLLLLVLLFPIVMVVKFVGMFLGSYAAFKDARPAFFTSLGMLSRGELSLIIVSAAVTSKLLPLSYLGLTAFIVFFSVITSFILLSKSSEIYTFIRIRFPKIKGISPNNDLGI